MLKMDQFKIGVIGLGYVGGPLAQRFAEFYPVIGYDVDRVRIEILNEGIDEKLEIDPEKLKAVLESYQTNQGKRGLKCVCTLDEIRDCNVYIVAVPTPVNKYNHPDLTPIKMASETVGLVLSKGDIVIYESTVYPGVTEEKCVPILEKASGLTLNHDFFVGYSPERINPGDKEHTFENIKKIVSGSSPEAARVVERLYNSVLKNGTHCAPTIRVAEAAKIVENIQRDVNIALMNELAKIFNRMEIDTREVIDAAATKWNFIRFSPGLVGGHCIGVDPYYMIEKAKIYGYMPYIMTDSRILNDSMAAYVAERLIRKMNKKGVPVKNAAILILGYTFKENCPDTRNTKVKDIAENLKEFTSNITIFDPWVNENEYKLVTNRLDPTAKYDAVIGAVAHSEFKTLDVKKYLNPNGVVYDIPGMFNKEMVDERL